MHICPAEIGAALILFEQITHIFWYLIWRGQEILRDCRSWLAA